MISCYCLTLCKLMANIGVGHGPPGPPGESGLDHEAVHIEAQLKVVSVHPTLRQGLIWSDFQHINDLMLFRICICMLFILDTPVEQLWSAFKSICLESRAAPIMLLILPIILLRISFKVYLLFQNYSQLLPIIPKLFS